MRERGGDRDIGPLLANINANRHRFMGSMHDMELLANVLDGGGDEGRAMAVELWLEIAELYPEHPRAEVALARAVSLADVDAGIEILERLTSLYPDSPLRYLAHERLIERLIRAERFDEAIDYSKSLISLPDAGFVDAGAARDTLARQGKWGRSYECVGHGGWFMAGQTRVQPLGMTMILVSPGGVIRRAEGVDTVDVEAATAAASLRDSACREPRLLMLVGEALAGTPTYLELGIELLELAIESHDGSSAAPGPAGLDQMGSTMERLRAQLAALYLDVGRLDDAVALVDRMREVAAGSPSPVDRVAGRILEAAGRIDEAKVYYLRGGSGADLERVYRATADNSLETFAREDAPRLRRDARLLVPDLDVEAPLHRLLGDELTLIVLWSPQFEATRAHLESLEALGESFANSDLETLSIAAGNITYRSMTRRLASNPPPRNPARATFDLLAALGIDELPMTLLVDREGRILARQMSFGIGAEAWRAAWSAVIEGRY